MDKIKRKILFSGITDKTETEIRHHLDESEFDYRFCSFNETESVIENYHPELIVTAVSSSLEDYENHISQLKIISRLYEINLAVLVNWSKENPYIFLINNGIVKFITSPVLKQDLIDLINRYLPVKSAENETVEKETVSNDDNVSEDSCTEGERMLISNLVIQNRMLKDFLKKNRHEEDYEKIHFEHVSEIRLFEDKLWHALENNYFKLYYQPVVSLESGKLSGFEALIRLIHPEDGIIPPDEFIPVAEKSAIIFPLGLWIIEEACRQVALWKDKFFLDTPLRININLSARQFIHPELTSHIFEITEKHAVTENDIGFELTESAFMEDMEAANMALLELKSRKYSIYMDDFGTGYSSLSYLMHFPVNVVKIDQSFVKWMHIDEQSEILVRSIINLAINLGLKVVAEGTEEESQVELLKACGCHYAQGYYYSKPVPPEEAEVIISKHFREK